MPYRTAAIKRLSLTTYAALCVDSTWSKLMCLGLAGAACDQTSASVRASWIGSRCSRQMRLSKFTRSMSGASKSWDLMNRPRSPSVRASVFSAPIRTLTPATSCREPAPAFHDARADQEERAEGQQREEHLG